MTLSLSEAVKLLADDKAPDEFEFTANHFSMRQHFGYGISLNDFGEALERHMVNLGYTIKASRSEDGFSDSVIIKCTRPARNQPVERRVKRVMRVE